jgi:DNA polymerase elongation subunit (family B)
LFIEKDYSILQKKETIRQVIYPLLDKTISNSDNDDLEDILKAITALDNDQVKKFKEVEVLENVALSEIIRFTNDIYKKEQFLDFIYQVIYDEIAKNVLERKQLHKIIEKTYGFLVKNIPVLLICFQMIN